LLFVALFGVLALVMLIAFGVTLRTGSAADIERREGFARDLRAVWLASLLFWTAWAAGPAISTWLFGIVSFIALRELITITHTRRADHRSLLLAFFVVLPVQYLLVAQQRFDLFSVFVPVYVFLGIAVVSAFGNDPQRFLERTAKIQWGIMVCVYGISHTPALLWLEVPGHAGRGAFLVIYLVAAVAIAQIVQEAASRHLRRRPVARAISRSFSWRAWALGVLSAGVMGALLYWVTPFKPFAAVLMGGLAGGCGTMGEFVMKALKRDAGVRNWGGQASVTGAVGLLDRIAPLCFAAPVFFHAVRWYFGL
jgi:phosphatidate cytidylyltransferase